MGSGHSSLPGDTRGVSLHERNTIFNRNAGFPQAISLLYAYPSPSYLPSEEHLKTRIKELQEHFPYLHCRLQEGRTRKPFFRVCDIWDSQRVLLKREYVKCPGDETLEMEKLLKEAVLTRESTDIEKEPFWSIVFFTTDSSSRAYLAISTGHEIMDGRGLQTLAKALFADSIADLPYELLHRIPKLEDKVDIRPTYGHLLPEAFRALLLPKLPNFMQNYFKLVRPWPEDNCAKSPIKVPWDQSLLCLPPDLITALKMKGQEHGVQALHATLATAFLLAIWSIHIAPNTKSSGRLVCETPRSERDPTLGHAYCTVNYVSGLQTTIDAEYSTSFWSVAQATSHDLHSKKGIRRGRGRIGLLAYVPDPTPDPKMKGTNRPTGWEKFFLDQAESRYPFDESMIITNLGYADLPAGAVDLVWGSGSAPFHAAYLVSVIGHKKGLRVLTSLGSQR